MSPPTDTDKILGYPTPIIGNKTYLELISFLKSVLQGRVLQAHLFGSYARKNYEANSDLDLMLVKDTATPFIKRSREFIDLFEAIERLDLLVYTPGEFEKLTTNPTLGFWQHVAKDKIQII